MFKMILIIMSSTMIQFKNQMYMVAFIILMCVSMSMWMFLTSNIHWFSLLVMLIYISGVMVLFMFIVSLSPNEKTPTKMNKKMLVTTTSILFISKLLMESESLKINSSLEYSPTFMTMSLLMMTLMAYLPPKIIKAIYKGMKSTK